MANHNRRTFLQLFLAPAIIKATSAASISQLFSACASAQKIIGLPASSADQLQLLAGLNYKILIKKDDAINAKEFFGDNCDYLTLSYLNQNEAILWVNHEYLNPVFNFGVERTLDNIRRELKLVGGSLIHIQRGQSEHWQVVNNSIYNRRIDATTSLPFSNGEVIAGSNKAVGTLGNCAGGFTPWGTILTAEENFQMNYGDRSYASREIDHSENLMQWHKLNPYPPEHYGWIVEIDPKTGVGQKHTALGRYSHECATCVVENGRLIVYSGDDKNSECLYKFVSDGMHFKSGKLYVANLERGEWILLDQASNPKLKDKFKSQLDILTYTREAADLVGGSKLDRPEDIEIDPLTGEIFVSLTNNSKRLNFHGQILKIKEVSGYIGEKFVSQIFLSGGEADGFSCPDNLAFDYKGNLWFTSDIAGSKLNQYPYKHVGNNGLYMVPRSGKMAGSVIRVASAPVEAELTGPCFARDYKTLFLSVQHPGEMSQDVAHLTSTWPDGSIPKSAVVTIGGETLQKLIEGSWE
jgi:hypothetical protein